MFNNFSTENGKNKSTNRTNNHWSRMKFILN